MGNCHFNNLIDFSEMPPTSVAYLFVGMQVVSPRDVFERLASLAIVDTRLG